MIGLGSIFRSFSLDLWWKEGKKLGKLAGDWPFGMVAEEAGKRVVRVLVFIYGLASIHLSLYVVSHYYCESPRTAIFVLC